MSNIIYFTFCLFYKKVNYNLQLGGPYDFKNNNQYLFKTA